MCPRSSRDRIYGVGLVDLLLASRDKSSPIEIDAAYTFNSSIIFAMAAMRKKRTPQACNIRNHHLELSQHKVAAFDLSTQAADYQLEMAGRLNLPFEILSDCESALCDALRLPTFETAGMRLAKRLTLIVRDCRIEHVFYPVFPPDKSADQVLHWLRSSPS